MLTIVKFIIKAMPLGVLIACNKAQIFGTKDLPNIFVNSV